MIELRAIISVLAINANGLHSPTINKKFQFGSWNKTQGVVQKMHLKWSDSEKLKIKRWPNYTRQMAKKESRGGNPEIRQSRNQAPKHWYKEKHFLMLKATIHDEDRIKIYIFTWI